LKKLILLFSCICALGKAQDTLHYTLHSDAWAYSVDSLLIKIDKKQNTEYYNFDGKQIPLTENTPIISYYRGVRRKLIIFN
jgi:hypothetical protein